MVMHPDDAAPAPERGAPPPRRALDADALTRLARYETRAQQDALDASARRALHDWFAAIPLRSAPPAG